MDSQPDHSVTKGFNGKTKRLVPGECALHSGRIWGATRLAAGEVSAMEIERQGRWKSCALMMYVVATRDEEVKVSRVLASNNAVAEGI